MAFFDGVGQFINPTKVSDCTFDNDLGLAIRGGEVHRCTFLVGDGGTGITNTLSGLTVIDCEFIGEMIAITSDSGDADRQIVTNCLFQQSIKGIVTVGTLNQNMVITNNIFEGTDEQALDLVGVMHSVVEGNLFLGCADQLENTAAVVTLDANCLQVVINDNVFQDVGGTPAIRALGDDITIVGNSIEGFASGEPASAIALDGVRVFIVSNNIVNNHVNGATGGHGIEIDASSDGVVSGNQLRNVGTDQVNTYDFINVTTSDRVLIIGNHLDPELDVGQIRYGINMVSGNNNAVYANYLGDSSDYGTADSVDTATGTQVTPAAGAIGGQFAF